MENKKIQFFQKLDIFHIMKIMLSLAWQYQKDERLQRNDFHDNNAFRSNAPPNECGYKLVRLLFIEHHIHHLLT